MAAYKIYHKDGSVLTDYNGKEISVHSLEYNGTWMGECFVTTSFENEAPIDFSIGDYIIYRNERFEINYDPGKIKCSSRNSYGGAFRYEDVKFNALSDELVRCDMLDLVLYDNKMHYTALPQFSFYVESVDDLLDRIQANLDELYGEAAWKIYSRNKQRSLQRGGLEAEWVDIYGEDVTDNIIDSTSISINDQTCWDALSLVNSQFDINFVIRNRNIYVGTAGRPTSKIFKYGKENGLYEIEQNSESDQAIVTRLRAYGSNRNLPNRYYSDLGAIPFLNITGDYHDGSTENGLSVLMEDSVYAGMFTDIVYDNGSNTKHCRIKGRIDGYEFDGTLELVKKDATKSTTRLLVDGKAVSDAIKAKIDAGFVQVDFLSGANRSKFGGNRISYVSNLPNNMACDRLMLPGFPNETLQEWWSRQTEEKKLWLNPGGKDHIFSSDSHRPYVESLNIEKIGIRPSSVFFEQDDKVNGIIEIYPTIEEMEVDGVRIDEIYTGTSVDDDGRFGDGESVANVSVILSPKINFDIRALMQDDFTLCMKDGMCAGREFKVASCTKQEDGSWKLLIERSEDSGLALYFPYKDFQINKGDHFVLTGIELPDAYVNAASEKLLKYCIAYLDKNDYTRYVYQPKVDEIFMARQHDTAMSDTTGTTKSLYLTLKEGDIMLFKDEDLGIDAEITIDQLVIKEEDGNIPTYDITLREEKEVGTIQKIQNQISSMVSGNGGFAGGSSYTPSQIKDIVNSVGSDRFLSKVNPDTAQGLITFIQGLVSEGKITAKQGVEIGSFVTGLIGGSGARIDKDGNGEMESLVIRQFLEVPELRFNRIDVVSGELWNSICTGTIEAVDTKKRIVTLKLQEGELSGIEVGDIIRGVFHCLESSNPSEYIAEDECGFQQMAGFSTSYFTPTEVYDDGARFKYSLRSGTSVHPQVGMKFAVYGSFTNPARRASAYHTRTYTRYLNAVDTWRISPDKNIYGQQGNLEGLTINEMEMHGYGGYFHNIYMSGVHVEFDRDWLDHNLPKVYSVHLTTYEHTIVTDIEGNPLNGLEELRNVITGESNVMSGDDNVIATRLAVTTTILAHKGTTPLLYSDTMDEGRFIVTLACVGCTAEVDNGVVKVTSIDKESAEHRVDISVNCEGEGVYVQTFNIPVVKQGENGITADLDNEMASIAANDKGEPLVVPFEEIVSHGRMWYGNEPMYLTSAEIAVPGGITVADVTTITDSEGNHNYLPIDSEHKQCTLRITKVDASAADTNEIRISLTGRVKKELNTEYSKTVVFKLNKVRMGENALNYQLMVSTPQLQVDGKGNFTTAGVSCSVIASDGKTLKELTSSELASAGLALNVQLYNGTSDYSAEQAYTYQSTLGNGSSIGGYTLTKDSVRLVFYLYWNDIIIDKEGVPIIKDGSSTVRIDLDNENDSILYNENGSKVSESCVTNINVYDGSKNVTNQCTLAIDSYSGVTCSLSGTQCTVSDVSSTNGWVKVRAYYPADGNYYYAIFSIKRLVGEDKYEIVTIPSSVVYDPNNKAYSERYPDVYVYRTDQQGNRTSVGGSLSLYGLKLQYSYNGNSWYTVSNGYVTADYQNPNIYLRLTDSNGYVRDSETIPIVIGGLNGCFKSIVFKRTNTKPDTPAGGSYSDPLPSGWEDGIPAGNEILWSSSCIFYADGSSSGWTEPMQMTDTADFDVEFSSLKNPDTPTGHPTDTPGWSNKADNNTLWMATSRYKNGTWSDWEVVKIKGEAGKDSTSYWFVCPTNSFNLSQTGSFTPANVKVTMKKKTGEGNVEDCSDYYLSVWEVTSSGTNRKSSAKASSVTVYAPSSSAQRVEVIATASNEDSYPSTTNIIAQYSFSINKDGANGDTGDTIFLTPKGVYSPGEEYIFQKKDGATAYERDYVLYSSDGGSYKTYAVKIMGASLTGVTPTDSNKWEELSKYQSVLADTIIGTNCNLGGFMVSNQEMQSESFKDGKGIYVNGKVGQIIIKQSEGWQWRVDQTGMMTAGIESGQRVVINPSTKDISLYDANGNVVTTISGETISTISSLFGTSGTLTTNNLSTLSISGDGHSINSTTTTKIMVSSFSASAGSVVKASLYVGLFASAYSASSSSTIQAPGNHISTKLILVNSSNTKIGNISNTISAFGDTVNESNSGTLSGSITIPSSGYYYIKLEISYIVGKDRENEVRLSSVNSASAQLISNTYLSRLLANGFCFGSSSANFIAALNESDNMHFNFTAGATNLEMTTSKFNLQSQYGKVFPVILYAACRIESSTEYGIGTYYSADGVKPTLTRTSTGQYELNYSSGLPLLTTGNAIITVTPYTSASVIANLGSLSTTSRSLPIYLYNINGSSQDAYFFVRVEYIG